jgi:hypothetical protein
MLGNRHTDIQMYSPDSITLSSILFCIISPIDAYSEVEQDTTDEPSDIKDL